MPRTRSLLVVGLLCAALTLAACGGDDESSAGGAATATPAATESGSASAGGGATVALSAPADGSLRFDQTDVTAKAGKVTISFDNPSSVPHAVEVEGAGVEEETECGHRCQDVAHDRPQGG